MIISHARYVLFTQIVTDRRFQFVRTENRTNGLGVCVCVCGLRPNALITIVYMFRCGQFMCVCVGVTSVRKYIYIYQVAKR